MSFNLGKVLVYGANGAQGGAIAIRLRQEGFAVRGVVRDPSRSIALQRAGIEVAVADLDDGEALRRANAGVDAVLLTLPLEWNVETAVRWAKHALAAAHSAHVRFIVLNSGVRLPAEPSDVPAFELRRAVEQVVQTSNIPTISLRPPMFMENLLSPAVAAGIVGERALAYPVPARLRVAWLSLRDLGSYVAVALRRRDLAGQAFEVSGPEPLEGHAVAEQLGRALGFPVAYHALSPDVFERMLIPTFGETVARGIAKTYVWLAKHEGTPLFTSTDNELRRGLTRPLSSVEAWARHQAWQEIAAKSA
jgi:NAD(P)H dehydrogenase (quinone)